MKNIAMLVLFVLVSFAPGMIGSRYMPGEWYYGLTKPSFNPPGWIFAPVWTLLYLTMGVSSWLVWKKAGFAAAGLALGVFGVQLILNGLWSKLFFGLHRPDLAFYEIVCLWISIGITINLFNRHCHGAAALLIPYFAWVSFATVLNFSIMSLNPAGGAKPMKTTRHDDGAKVVVRLLDEDGKLTPPASVSRIVKADNYWRRVLAAEQYAVARSKGTEAPFCGVFHDNKKPGIYICVCCGLPLFGAKAKFDSGTGWPSFFQPLASENVVEHEDRSLGMSRTEILCARCDAHLGHVFNDGPKPTGLRYCLNSVSLAFMPDSDAGKHLQKAGFAAGCFWGVEDVFRQVKGVKSAYSGYAGGHVAHPTYEEVCSGETGHAEAVMVTFDPAEVTFPQLLDVFWKCHDPTTPNRQGPDIGSQYRSAIFCYAPEQKTHAEASKAKLDKSGQLKQPVVTEIIEAKPFYRAEEYHQRFNEKHGLAGCHL